eukprot:scaffold3.g6452.t1
MMLFGFNATKAKTQCKLGIRRIKLMKNKRTLAQLKQFRKEVAELLRQDKQGNARIRVEAVIREQALIHSYEILELYLELISMRVELMQKSKLMPADMVEAICSVVYAGQRVATDLAEVATLRKMLVDKYQAVMQEIAQEFDAPFDADKTALEMLPTAGKPLAVLPHAPPAADAWVGPGPPVGEPAAAASWQPAAARAGGAAEAAAATHAADVLGTSVVIRPGAGAAPAAPSSSSGGPLPPGWSPPPPQDGNAPGKAFHTHLASAGNWAQAKRAASEGGAAGAGSGGSPPPRAGDEGGLSECSSPSRTGGAVTPASSYQDAAAAAEAAKRYSDMAREAAEAAEQYARTSGRSGGGLSAAGSGSGVASSPVQGGGAGHAADPEFLRVQRQYDAAPGPPAKGEAGPPSAPPAPPAYAPPPAVAAAAPPAPPPAFDLPQAPTSGTGAAPAPPGDPLDELTARFEALKRR